MDAVVAEPRGDHAGLVAAEATMTDAAARWLWYRRAEQALARSAALHECSRELQARAWLAQREARFLRRQRARPAPRRTTLAAWVTERVCQARGLVA
jgi:hypothetical protein